ncbi:cyclic lactone autoinducer peptide [Desulfonispora thiosulfatigenes DSM 11270]|uniref:Cyclic lactone autoinducer peptide n=1 Tax=Desulfonispora thiosulfatigenes DSM 11270 TaxID=656914 RepID=A0A1W1V3J5_DESTI|nr:cyclic lactone autoinducer peptide [Desulfonispora thiosulfatigenes]SMB87939.1 cyclic lactone autoinducer peptide [Desulfonispora thiosulfatigenes DSM 11270]
MKNLFYRFSGVAIAALFVVAKFGASTMCMFGHYQPETPKSLQK